MGIDPGTRLVGYAVVQAISRSRFRYIECGVLKASEGEVGDRIQELATGVGKIIEEFRPEEMAIESAFTHVNASSALKLAEARGAMKYVGRHKGLPVSEYAPTRVKRAVVGKGQATKAEVQARVRVLCGLEKEPSSDAADALAIAICHFQSRTAATKTRPEKRTR